ncbi:MAG: glycosyltransferase family 4 protein [Deltaproteobacteria bacterium]|nr:glycosyltransferase family 4 protein [Deltaproteobacteria bacterium]
MKKIKLAHCLKALEIGGIEKYIKTLVDNIDKDKYEILLYCNYNKRTQPFVQEIIGKGVRVVFLSEATCFQDSGNVKVMSNGRNKITMLLRHIYHFMIPERFRKILYVLPLIFQDVPRLYKEFRNETIDVIHFNAGHRLWLVAEMIAARLARIPRRILTVHNCNIYPNRGFEQFIHRLLERLALLCVDKVIAVSEDAKDIFVSQLQIKPSKVVAVYNGVDLKEIDRQVASVNIPKLREQFLVEDDFFVIGMFARLSYVKGHKFLIEAIKTIKEENPSINIVVFIAGDGPIKEDLINFSVQEGVSSCFKFLGHIANVHQVIPLCNIVVLPALCGEGFGYTLAEAMACYKPVIGTSIGGITNVIDKSTGILVPPGDSLALADAILKLMRDREEGKRMGLAGRKKVEALFRQDEMIRKTVNLYS